MSIVQVDQRSLSTATGCWLAVTLALVLHLDDPWWAAFSALRISDPNRKVEISLAVHRLVGCILGYLLALHTQNLAFAQVLCLFAAAVVGTYQRFADRHGDAWFLGALMVVLLIVTMIEDPAETLYWALLPDPRDHRRRACGPAGRCPVFALAPSDDNGGRTARPRVVREGRARVWRGGRHHDVALDRL